MKLAILTITDGQNYGNRLQNYALQEVLRDLGHDVTTIRRRTFHDRTPAQRSVQGAKNLVKSMLGRDYEAPTAARRRAFDAFNRRCLTFSDPVLHDNLAPPELAGQYDRFIVGSDQVWNAQFRIIYDDIRRISRLSSRRHARLILEINLEKTSNPNANRRSYPGFIPSGSIFVQVTASAPGPI